MAIQMTCDYCGEAIKGDRYATVKFLGLWENTRQGLIADDDRHYHSGDADHLDASCYAQAFRALIDRRPSELDAIPVMSGLERQKIERARRWKDGTPVEPALGATIARRLERVDVYTLEEAAALSEGQLLAVHGLGPKRVEQIRQALSEHVPSSV